MMLFCLVDSDCCSFFQSELYCKQLSANSSKVERMQHFWFDLPSEDLPVWVQCSVQWGATAWKKRVARVINYIFLTDAFCPLLANNSHCKKLNKIWLCRQGFQWNPPVACVQNKSSMDAWFWNMQVKLVKISQLIITFQSGLLNFTTSEVLACWKVQQTWHREGVLTNTDKSGTEAMLEMACWTQQCENSNKRTNLLAVSGPEC